MIVAKGFHEKHTAAGREGSRERGRSFQKWNIEIDLQQINKKMKI